MISRKNQVMLFYLILIVLLAIVAVKLNKPTTNKLNNALIGGGSGLLISIVLWFAVGKKWSGA
jgi:uncharacterized membrane protein